MLLLARGNAQRGYRGVARDERDTYDVVVCPHRHLDPPEARACVRALLARAAALGLDPHRLDLILA